MEETEDAFGVPSERMGATEMVGADDLISIKPFSPDPEQPCLNCQSPATSFDRLIFQGIHVLARYLCRVCQAFTWRTLGIGHDELFPAAFGEGGKNLTSNPDASEWLIQPLIRSLFQNTRSPATISVGNETVHAKAIILNCLDNRFGHAFAKLWNATVVKKKYPQCALIVIVPANLQWLVPHNVDEVWIASGPLAELNRYLTNLEEAFSKATARFGRVWLSKAYTHLSPEHVDFPALLNTKPFDLSSFASSKPQITFVLREDRLWQGGAVEYLMLRIVIKLGLSRSFFIQRQNRRVKKAVRELRKRIPEAEVVVAGIGRSGELGTGIRDLRRTAPSGHDEQDWCCQYARSHVVIGVHGSNMLIPTALAAGFIEIIPRYKIRHMAEDVLLNHPPRLALFLGRHLDGYVSPEKVAIHAASMIRYFPYLYSNFRQRP